MKSPKTDPNSSCGSYTSVPEGAPGAGPAAGAEAPQDSEKKKDDDIVDADFEVVDDEKEKS